jgi:hypothetical protein
MVGMVVGATLKTSLITLAILLVTIALPLTVAKNVASVMVPKVPAMPRIRTAHFARRLVIAQ